MSKTVGYARVSTSEQNLDRQLQALSQYVELLPLARRLYASRACCGGTPNILDVRGGSAWILGGMGVLRP